MALDSFKKINKSLSFLDNRPTVCQSESKIFKVPSRSYSSEDSILKKIKDDFDGKFENGTIILNFKNNKIPLIYSAEDLTYFFDIEGDDLSGEKVNCFSVSIDPSSKQAMINNINVKNSHCPLPAEKKGQYLLEFVDALSKSLNISEVLLVDSSFVECQLDKKTTSLQFLKVMQKGKGWYESNGYFPIMIDQDDYYKKISTLRNYSLINLRKKIDELKKKPIHKKQVAQIALALQKLSEFNAKNSSDHLHEFFNWLWNSDCKNYSQIKDLLFPDNKLDNGLGTTELFPDFSLLKKKF